MNKFKGPQKEYLTLSSLLINIIGKRQILHHIKDWKKHEKNNNTIALNIVHVPYNIKGIRHACKSKYNSMLKYQVIVLMIADRKRRHYFVLKKLSALLRGVTHVGDLFKLLSFIQ